MIEAILRKLFKIREIPHPDGGLYLRRYFITPRWFPLRVFVHQIFTPDPDRSMHDHPWDFVTFPLSGYHEIRLHDVHGRFNAYIWPWQCHTRPAEYVHSIYQLDKSPTWTIMVTNKARREWGFWVDDKWVHWREYLGLPDEPVSWEDVVK